MVYHIRVDHTQGTAARARGRLARLAASCAHQWARNVHPYLLCSPSVQVRLSQKCIIVYFRYANINCLAFGVYGVYLT